MPKSQKTNRSNLSSGIKSRYFQAFDDKASRKYDAAIQGFQYVLKALKTAKTPAEKNKKHQAHYQLGICSLEYATSLPVLPTERTEGKESRIRCLLYATKHFIKAKKTANDSEQKNETHPLQKRILQTFNKLAKISPLDLGNFATFFCKNATKNFFEPMTLLIGEIAELFDDDTMPKDLPLEEAHSFVSCLKNFAVECKTPRLESSCNKLLALLTPKNSPAPLTTTVKASVNNNPNNNSSSDNDSIDTDVDSSDNGVNKNQGTDTIDRGTHIIDHNDDLTDEYYYSEEGSTLIKSSRQPSQNTTTEKKHAVSPIKSDDESSDGHDSPEEPLTKKRKQVSHVQPTISAKKTVPTNFFNTNNSSSVTPIKALSSKNEIPSDKEETIQKEGSLEKPHWEACKTYDELKQCLVHAYASCDDKEIPSLVNHFLYHQLKFFVPFHSTPISVTLTTAPDTVVNPVAASLNRLPFKVLLEMLSQPLPAEKISLLKQAIDIQLPRVTEIETMGATIQQYLLFNNYIHQCNQFLHAFNQAKTDKESIDIFNKTPLHILHLSQRSVHASPQFLQIMAIAASQHNNSNHQQPSNTENNSNKIKNTTNTASTAKPSLNTQPQQIISPLPTTPARPSNEHQQSHSNKRQLEHDYAEGSRKRLNSNLSFEEKSEAFIQKYNQCKSVPAEIALLVGTPDHIKARAAKSPNAPQALKAALQRESAINNAAAQQINQANTNVLATPPRIATTSQPIPQFSQPPTATLSSTPQSIIMQQQTLPRVTIPSPNELPIVRSSSARMMSQLTSPQRAEMPLSLTLQTTPVNLVNNSPIKTNPIAEQQTATSSIHYYWENLEKRIGITNLHPLFIFSFKEGKLCYEGTSYRSQYSWDDITSCLANLLLDSNPSNSSLGEFLQDTSQQKISASLLYSLVGGTATVYKPTSNNTEMQNTISNNNNSNTARSTHRNILQEMNEALLQYENSERGEYETVDLKENDRNPPHPYL